MFIISQWLRYSVQYKYIKICVYLAVQYTQREKQKKEKHLDDMGGKIHKNKGLNLCGGKWPLPTSQMRNVNVEAELLWPGEAKLRGPQYNTACQAN
jgi:hypothetical protein